MIWKSRNGGLVVGELYTIAPLAEFDARAVVNDRH